MLKAENMLRKTKGQTQVAMAKSGAQVGQVTLSDCCIGVKRPRQRRAGWGKDHVQDYRLSYYIIVCGFVTRLMTSLAYQPLWASVSASPQDPDIRSNFFELLEIYTNIYFSKLWISIEHVFFPNLATTLLCDIEYSFEMSEHGFCTY